MNPYHPGAILLINKLEIEKKYVTSFKSWYDNSGISFIDLQLFLLTKLLRERIGSLFTWNSLVLVYEFLKHGCVGVKLLRLLGSPWVAMVKIECFVHI